MRHQDIALEKRVSARNASHRLDRSVHDACSLIG